MRQPRVFHDKLHFSIGGFYLTRVDMQYHCLFHDKLHFLGWGLYVSRVDMR